ncbi:MAG: substrate-binding periplasmic protein [Rhodopila sp.]
MADEPAPLRLCADPDNLPYSSAGQQIPGLYIDLGQQLAQALGRRFQAVWVPTYYPKRQVRQKLLTGQCDGFLGLPDDPGFMGPQLIFSQPIVRVGYALVAPLAMKLTSVQGLHGHRVAVQWGSPQSLLATWKDVQTVTAMSPEAAMKDLANGKAEAAFIWGPSAGWQNGSALGNAYRVVSVDGDHMQWDAGIAFARDHAALRDDVNRALDRLAPAIKALSVRYGFTAQTPEQAGTEAASSKEPAAAEPKASAADIIEGQQIFNTTCAHCHGHDAVKASSAATCACCEPATATRWQRRSSTR